MANQDPGTGAPGVDDTSSDRSTELRSLTLPNQADHHKHMDYVQAVIARLANDSFLVKGWALTVSIAVLGYAVANLDWRVALVGFVPGALFWHLDSYFLHRETLFRRLFDDVANGTVRDFSMKYAAYLPEVSRRKVFFSETLTWFYGFILSVAAVVLTATAIAGPNTPPEEHPERDPSPSDSRSP